MAWEKRGEKDYYYKPARVDGKPRKIYLGYGPAGRAHEILDRQAKRKKQPVLDAQARVRQLMREGDRLWCESWTWLWLLVESRMLLAGYYRHRGEWRRASRKPRTRQSRALPAAPEVVTDLPAYLRSLNQQANGGEPDAIDALRVFLDENRAILAHVEDLNRASMRLWEGHQYQPLDQDRAESSESGSLERLLVDAVRIAEMNRRHADSLIEPGAVTAIACSTRYARIQKADNRLEGAKRLLSHSDRLLDPVRADPEGGQSPRPPQPRPSPRDSIPPDRGES